MIARLRQAEMLIGHSKSAALACKEVGVVEQLQEKRLKPEILYSLKEARGVVEA